MIKGSIFDFGNVICTFDNSVFLKKISSFTNKSVKELDEIIYKSSELPKKYDDNLDLYDSIKKHGVINPVPLGFTDQAAEPKISPLLFGKSQYVIGGHHRIAAAEDINPNMEIPVMYYDIKDE